MYTPIIPLEDVETVQTQTVQPVQPLVQDRANENENENDLAMAIKCNITGRFYPRFCKSDGDCMHWSPENGQRGRRMHLWTSTASTLVSIRATDMSPQRKHRGYRYQLILTSLTEEYTVGFKDEVQAAGFLQIVISKTNDKCYISVYIEVDYINPNDGIENEFRLRPNIEVTHMHGKISGISGE